MKITLSTQKWSLSLRVKGALTITVLTDELAGEGIETIEVTLVDPVANAILGAAKWHHCHYEEEVPPVLKVSTARRVKWSSCRQRAAK